MGEYKLFGNQAYLIHPNIYMITNQLYNLIYYVTFITNTHCKDPEAWSDLNPSVVKNMCKKLHDHAWHATCLMYMFFNTLLIFVTRQNAGVDSLDMANTHLVGDAKDHVHDELEGRTGETDSEMSGAD